MYRTTIELDEVLVEQAKAVLGKSTIKATVEEALRRVVDAEMDASARKAKEQRLFLSRLADAADLNVLGSGEMWRWSAGYSARSADGTACGTALRSPTSSSQ